MFIFTASYWHQFVRSFIETIPAMVVWYANFIIAFTTAYVTGPRRVIVVEVRQPDVHEYDEYLAEIADQESEEHCCPVEE